MMTAAIGLVAGALTTIAWLPQLHRTWRKRSAHELSWPYLAMTYAGIGLWFTYGVVSHDLAVIVANAVTLVLLTGVLTLKVRHPHPAVVLDALEPADELRVPVASEV